MWQVFLSKKFINGFGAAGKYNILVVDVSDGQLGMKKVDDYDLDILLKDIFIIGSGKTIYEAFINHPNIQEIENRRSSAVKSWAERITENICSGNIGSRTLVLGNPQLKQIDRIVMPDGTDGLLCVKCGEYFPYVEENSSDGYVCYKHEISF